MRRPTDGTRPLGLGCVLALGAFFGACNGSTSDGAAGTSALPTDGGIAVARSQGPCSSTDVLPDDLLCTGLYADIGAKTLAPGVRPFSPAVALWSDGAEKQRWILLPEGKTIDAGNVDNWVFPVGTKAWKEFRIQGRRIETRLFWKVRDDRWMAASYRWSVDERAALRGEGSRVVLPDGAPYDIPSTTQCDECHKGRKDRLLGFEAVSLGQRGATGLSLETLVDEGRLSPAPAVRVLPLEERAGEPAAAALAWLHVQCGVSCHNSNSTATGYTTRLRLKLGFDEVLQLPRDQWQVHRTTVGVSAHQPKWAGGVRVVPQQPEQSLLFQLMVREGEGRMPPLGSHELDPDGVARVREWISRLPKDSGPPGDDAGPDAGAGRESGDTSDAGLEDAGAGRDGGDTSDAGLEDAAAVSR